MSEKESEPAETSEQAESAEPVESAEQAGSAEQVQPVERVQPVASVEPVVSVEPAVDAGVEVLASAGPESVAPAPARRRLRKGRVAAVAGSVLLAGAVVAGVGFTAVTVDGADRDAGAPVWKLPKAPAEKKQSEDRRGLAGTLVPYGTDGWSEGPDIGEFGADVQLSGAQATALRKQALGDLPRSQRKRLEKEIDKQPTTAMAMRSYYNHKVDPYNNDDIFTVRIVLAQMDSKVAVRERSTFQNEFLAALDVFRKGPQIKGHKDAKCFLPPKDSDEDLDSMFCSGYVGDVLVTATADGVKPLDTKGVAELLSTQLDRIAEPGKAV